MFNTTDGSEGGTENKKETNSKQVAKWQVEIQPRQ